ncbi:tetratricopeptide repeat protein [Jiulongibacter sp. NS-SX5]|uniref:tetratricopeptide repeat protein n=1 Tax=Jiulongibacter sp. NS-SX5 TaxID=3463854 RepID=UPI00405A2186
MKSLLFAFAAVLTVSFAGKAQTIEEARRHLNAERYIKAGEEFNNLVKTNPSEQTYFELGRYFLSTPDAAQSIDYAKDAFEKGIALDKKGSTLNTIGLAWVKIAQKDMAGAKVILDEIFKKGKNAKNPELLITAAEGYTFKDLPNDPAEAIMLLDKAQEVKKMDYPQLYIVRAKAFDIQNEGGDVMNSLQNAIRFNPKDKANIYSFMARIWLQGKNYKEAQEAIQNSIAADVEHAPAYRYSSSLNQTYQKWELAAAAAKKYLQYSDGDCSAKLRYTKIAFIAKDYDNVLSTINEIESCNEDPIVHRLAGIAKFEQGNPAAAVTDLKNYISTAEEEEIFGLDYGWLGRAYIELANQDVPVVEENEKLGIENIEKAVAMKDTTFDYYTHLGTYFQEKRKYPEAITFIKKDIATKKKPTGDDYWRLGYLQYVTKNYAGADSTFDKVCAAYGDSWSPPYLMSARAKAYSNTEDTTFQAADRYEKYLSLLSEDEKVQNARNVSEAYNYLAGKELAVNDDVEKATEYLDLLLKYDPENERAKTLRDSINGIMPEEEMLEEGALEETEMEESGK